MTAQLHFENVAVQYPVFNSRNMSLRNHLVRISTGGMIENETSQVRVVTALKDISFKINKGDAVGLIGHNGAGKSTLLRTMAGIYTPVHGKITRKGRVASVFDLSAGIDPELSGHDNITRLCLLLEMKSLEIIRNRTQIEEFTQLGDFLELPVRTYSTGMATRLVFAVATSIKPDILLVDEMFSTGDAEFQTMAKARMNELIRTAGIFVFASHNSEALKEYCNRFFHLEHGQLHEISAKEVV